jgi:hypothetical protein
MAVTVDPERLLARCFISTEIALDALERMVGQEHDHPAAAVGAARALAYTAASLADLLDRCGLTPRLVAGMPDVRTFVRETFAAAETLGVVDELVRLLDPIVFPMDCRPSLALTGTPA